MSYAQSNGYTNGYYSSSRVDEDPSPRESRRGSRPQRGGGYGGLTDDDTGPELDRQRQIESHTRGFEIDPPAGQWRRRPDRNDRDWSDSSRSRDRNPNSNPTRLYGDGPGGRQIEGVLQHIQQKWDTLARDDCVPVHLALQLLDLSSLGRGSDYDDFQKTNKQLQKALKAIVNEHHQGFNSSIGTFHKIQSSIHNSQIRVRALRDSLVHAKLNLTSNKPELRELFSTAQNYDDMLQILGQIEKLQMVPEQLDSRISGKRFLSAVDLLQDSLRLIRRSDLEPVGALADLRVYFSNQETSLTDILIEELHDHLYLKSPYCEDRYKPSQHDLSLENGSQKATHPSPTSRDWLLYQFLDSLDTSLPMADDTSRNPETESFKYLHLLIEALNKMGRLDVAVDRMEQRLPVELFAIVDRTNSEVDLRYPAHLRGSQNGDHSGRPYDLGEEAVRSEVLRDLLRTLYSKFEAIAEGHRVVHEVLAGTLKREGFTRSSALTGGFKELWKLYQSEMRSLLHDYLATDGNPIYRSRHIATAETNIFHGNQRDKRKRVFNLSDIDQQSEGLATEQEDLDQILEASVPGLVSKSQRNSLGSKNSKVVVHTSHVKGHKLLVEPSVFHISLLLPPSISFLQRLKAIVPPDSEIAASTLTSFLDDFLVNVFHPQLDETMTELCTRSLIELDAFQKDSQWAQHSQRPIFKGTLTFFTLVTAFCRVLDTLPQDQALTHMIISQMVTYYDKCFGWYKSLVTRVQPQAPSGVVPKPAAAMAEIGDLRDVVQQSWQGVNPDYADLFHKEITLLISKTNEKPLEPFDIISDRRTVEALCMLYNSMQWLASRLHQLRRIVDTQSQLSQHDSASLSQSRRWTLVNATKLDDENQPVYLPMTHESIIAFDGIITSFRALATTILLTLHIDIRCGIIHILAKTLRARYLLPQPANEPDPSVITLNADLVDFDENVTTYLPFEEHHFVITGLGLLVDRYLVANSSQISAMNLDGCGRMQLNILVLQQNLKTIEDEVTLGRSAHFFDLFTEGAEVIVARAKASEGKDMGFELEELKVLIELCYSEGLQSPQRETAMHAKKGLNDHIMQLSESMWNT